MAERGEKGFDKLSSRETLLEIVASLMDGDRARFIDTVAAFFKKNGMDIEKMFDEREKRLSLMGLDDEFDKWEKWLNSPDPKKKEYIQLDVETYAIQDEKYFNFYIRVMRYGDGYILTACPGQCSIDINTSFCQKFQRTIGADMATEMGFINKFKAGALEPGKKLQYFFVVNGEAMTLTEGDPKLEEIRNIFLPVQRRNGGLA